MPCGGDPAQICGAHLRLSLYRKDILRTIPRANGTLSWSRWIGCYHDPDDLYSASLVLAGTGIEDDAMTLERCEAFCALSGTRAMERAYTYWGVEFGRACYCADAIARGSVLVGDHECAQTECAGSREEKCGGHQRLAVFKYVHKAAVPTLPTTVRRYV